MNTILLTVASMEVVLAQSLRLTGECYLIPQKDIVVVSVEAEHLSNVANADESREMVFAEGLLFTSKCASI